MGARVPVSEESSNEGGPARFPRWVPWALVGIPALSVPWYWPSGTVRPFVMGLPVWAFVSLVACVAFAATTSFVILRYWKDPE